MKLPGSRRYSNVSDDSPLRWSLVRALEAVDEGDGLRAVELLRRALQQFDEAEAEDDEFRVVGFN